MLDELNIMNHHHIQKCSLDKRNETKDKLIRWLATVCFILFLIKLKQEVLLQKSDKDFKSVKYMVQKELKIYSSMLSKSCSSAPSPKKLEVVVKKAAFSDDMSKNSIVYVLVETEHERLLEKVEVVLAEIGERPKLSNCSRVGTKRVDGSDQ